MLSRLARWLPRLRPRLELPDHLVKGRRAEELAARWLRREAGIRWRDRNWTHGKGEIDLIGVAPDGQWIFVEVRSRQASALVSGYHSITRKKKKLLRQTILAYLRTLPVVPAWRFDVVEVRWHPEAEPELRHFAQVRLGPHAGPPG